MQKKNQLKYKIKTPIYTTRVFNPQIPKQNPIIFFKISVCVSL